MACCAGILLLSLPLIVASIRSPGSLHGAPRNGFSLALFPRILNQLSLFPAPETFARAGCVAAILLFAVGIASRKYAAGFSLAFAYSMFLATAVMITLACSVAGLTPATRYYSPVAPLSLLCGALGFTALGRAAGAHLPGSAGRKRAFGLLLALEILAVLNLSGLENYYRIEEPDWRTLGRTLGRLYCLGDGVSVIPPSAAPQLRYYCAPAAGAHAVSDLEGLKRCVRARGGSTLWIVYALAPESKEDILGWLTRNAEEVAGAPRSPRLFVHPPPEKPLKVRPLPEWRLKRRFRATYTGTAA